MKSYWVMCLTLHLQLFEELPNFSIVIIPSYIPHTGNVWGSHLPLATLLFSVFFHMHPCGCEVISHCFSLLTNDVEHLFMWLWNICLSSLDKYLVKFFAYFKN